MDFNIAIVFSTTKGQNILILSRANSMQKLNERFMSLLFERIVKSCSF